MSVGEPGWPVSMITVVSVAVLLSRSGSAAREVTLPVLLSVPIATGVTLIRTVASAPAFRLSIWHVTVPDDAVHEPSCVFAERNVAVAGSGSTRRTVWAVSGPAFSTTIV